MKIRSGFVSNSSSSSYIVAFDSSVDLHSLFVSGPFSGSQTSVDAIGVDDVIEELKDWHGIGVEQYLWSDDEDKMQEHYYKSFIRFAVLASKVAKAIDDGDDVALVCISYGDDNSLDNLSSVGVRIIESFG